MRRRPSHPTVRTDRVYGGSAGRAGHPSPDVCPVGLSCTSAPWGQSAHTGDASTGRCTLLAAPIYLARSGSAPFRPSTAPGLAAGFPTDFSSTMPFADCPWALAYLAARPLRVATCVRVPVAGLVSRPSRTLHAEALVSRSASSPAFVSQSLGLSRGSPWLLSMRNCRVYVERRIGNRDFRLCCTLVPVPAASYPPKGCQFPLLLCAISPHLRLRPLPGHRYRLSPCPWLPFAVT